MLEAEEKADKQSADFIHGVRHCRK
jgi:hypothetical protein